MTQKDLEDKGWRLISRRGSIQYWNHDQHSKPNGLFFTKIEAEALQRRLNRRERELAKQRTLCFK